MPLIHASHILLPSRKIAVRLYTRLVNHELTFEDAVTRYSICASKAHEGDLGFMAPGLLARDFEQELWQAPIAQLSEPFASSQGWHIVWVHQKVWP
jgi:parvulin-like peptidyl-prolyl isomerase